MKTCKICGKLSATGKNHDDCIEKRRLERAETNNVNQEDVSTGTEVCSDLDALLGHIATSRKDN